MRLKLTALISSLALAGTASAGIITFDEPALGLVHGSYVFDQVPGLTIDAFNDRVGAFVGGAVFDTDLTGSTADPDLQRDPPNGRNQWSGGNLDPNTSTGLALFIPENFEDSQEDDVLDSPDDEGARPAGFFVLEFDNPITTFGFDLVDVEGINDEPGMIEFRSAADVILGSIMFSSFPGSDGAVFGDATLNRIAPKSAPAGTSIVRVYMGGSGAIDNLVFDERIPEPGTLTLLGLGLLGLVRMAGASRLRRRR